MLQTSLNSPSAMTKIRIHSPFLHAQLPQLLPKVIYVYRTRPHTLSMSPPTELAMKLESPSLTQMSPLTASSMTPTKKTSHPRYQRFHVLVPLFNHLAECMQQFPSQMILKQIKPSLLQSPKFETLSTKTKSTLATLKRLFGLLEPCDTEACPAEMTRWQLLLRDSTKSSDWTQSLPLVHHLPITSPMRHLWYRATCKSQ